MIVCINIFAIKIKLAAPKAEVESSVNALTNDLELLFLVLFLLKQPKMVHKEKKNLFFYLNLLFLAEL